MIRRKLKTVGRYVGYERNREDFGFFDYYFKISKSVIISIICIPFSLYFFFIKHFVEKNRIKWFKPKNINIVEYVVYFERIGYDLCN